jgi:hypothetical protein
MIWSVSFTKYILAFWCVSWGSLLLIFSVGEIFCKIFNPNYCEYLKKQIVCYQKWLRTVENNKDILNLAYRRKNVCIIALILVYTWRLLGPLCTKGCEWPGKGDFLFPVQNGSPYLHLIEAKIFPTNHYFFWPRRKRISSAIFPVFKHAWCRKVHFKGEKETNI